MRTFAIFNFSSLWRAWSMDIDFQNKVFNNICALTNNNNILRTYFTFSQSDTGPALEWLLGSASSAGIAVEIGILCQGLFWIFSLTFRYTKQIYFPTQIVNNMIFVRITTPRYLLIGCSFNGINTSIFKRVIEFVWTTWAL